MRTFSVWRDPFGEGFNLCRRKTIEIKEGLTVLVGCNGAGKTTLLDNIEQDLKKNTIPCVAIHTNDMDMSNKLGELMWRGGDNINIIAQSVTSSEGENISLRLRLFVNKLAEFIKTGEYDDGSLANKLLRSMREDSNDENQPSDERWILLDSTDSGYSIDNIIELKSVFDMIIDDAICNCKQLYIVVTANEYEMASQEECLDVNEGKYVKFDDYNAYKKFILKTRSKKDKRIQKLNEKKAKRIKVDE